ncbi:PBP1A family penicillin-binding protein [Phenylobacterium sp. J426]|uniref:transglycosylase domain-containing protein n=1 Tax=Phenylobacterium sp. J426 TaxID=2898439 RepID=UPI0021511EFE|nr:PBP1A family penicillin-binding protein [Phenylobacterium sp. J426]MCR5875246.1 PBP1A family penicillin-binding protein [Phenylobacterium sp. J426]
MIGLALLAPIGAANLVLAQAPELPRLPEIKRDPQVTYVDRSGAVIGVRGGRYAPPVDLAKVPAYVPAAFVAIEDRRFYEHNGVDARGIARAVAVAIDKGRATQGASTITQQLARNLFLSQDRTLERKATEIAYALQLERTYSKKQILALYLSRVYYGSGAYGLEAAAQRYFNKPASRLTLREAAILAGVLKSPTNYNPAEATDAALARSKLVLDAMVETGAISPAQRAKALAETPRIWKTAPNAAAQYFIDWIDDQVAPVAGKVRQDVVVETTLDMPMEQAAFDAARSTVARHKAARAEQAAVVAVDGAGRVRVMVGGTDYVRAPYNRAASAKRQAGSAWKPFVYLTALEQGRLPDSPVMDEPVTIAGWTPANYTETFLGPLTLEQALAQSVNTVAARLADEAGRPNVALTARRVGIVSTVNTDPAMALGTTLVTPLEMTQAYAAFANGGNRVQAYGIERIRTRAGVTLFQKTPPTPSPAIANPPLSDLNRMLRTAVTAGTGKGAAIPGYDLAGKTGTTSDYRDAWFCGYTGGFASCAWMGRDDNSPMGRIAGGGAPAELWRTFMAGALKRVPRQQIPPGPPVTPPPAPPWEPDLTPVAAPGALPAASAPG